MADRALGNPLGNPLGLARATGGGVPKVPAGSVVPFASDPGTDWESCNGQVAYLPRAADAPGVRWAYIAQIPMPAMSGATCIAVSPQADLIIAGSSSQTLVVFKKDESAYIKVADVAITGYSARSISFSHDGKHLAVAVYNAPGVFIFKVDGVSLTRLPDISGAPNNATAVQFSPDGMFLAVGGLTVAMYLRDGDSFTATSFSQGANQGDYLAFSPDGMYFAYSGYASNSYGFTLYGRSGNLFTKLSRLSSGGTSAYAVCFSADSKHLYACGNTLRRYSVVSPYDVVAFTSISSPYGVSTTDDGSYLFIQIGGAVSKYAIDSKTLGITLLDSDFIVSTRQGQGALQLSADGRHLVCAGNSSVTSPRVFGGDYLALPYAIGTYMRK